MEVFQRSFPTKRIKITNNKRRNIVFEASEDLLQLKNHLNALGTVARATKHEAVYDLYNAKKQEYHKRMDEEVRQKNIEYIQNGQNFQRAMWNVINNETKKTRRHTSSNFSSDDCNSYFVNRSEKILETIQPIGQSTRDPLHNLSIDKTFTIYFRNIAVKEITDTIRNLVAAPGPTGLFGMLIQLELNPGTSETGEDPDEPEGLL
ncbi:hypothetical protein HHI36_010150 [Cryptolaemus montrouzieri]|uniref:Uncharacterized protein n=1 Tax=Cryptolaemus montrouzieri TaxID=559131 RepID=A0ABD2MHX6_9CUCU